MPPKLKILTNPQSFVSKVILAGAVLRESCSEQFSSKTFPTTINSLAFAKACVITWNNVINFTLLAIEKIINPNCLKVESATIFFKSFSIKAANLAIISVTVPNLNKITEEDFMGSA